MEMAEMAQGGERTAILLLDMAQIIIGICQFFRIEFNNITIPMNIELNFNTSRVGEIADINVVEMKVVVVGRYA
jgi:hypothetical protein